MKLIAILTAALIGTGAHAAVMSLACQQTFTVKTWTMTGHPIPERRLAAPVRYRLDPDHRSITVMSDAKTTTFVDGGSEHVIVDRSGMTVAGTSYFPKDGPVTSRILHFTIDGSRGAGQQRMWLHGRLLQEDDTAMSCRRTG